MWPSLAALYASGIADGCRPRSRQGAAIGIAIATAPSEERVPVRNGLQIFIRSWIPATARPRAIVGIVHGVKSHSGYYHWAAKQSSRRCSEAA